jgi:tRNA G18 (ribose-2'-O)-methylase SpoU
MAARFSGLWYNSAMKKEMIVLAHNIRSAYNVGSFFRTADGVGNCRIVLSGYSARPDHPGVIKTALGAEKVVPWESITKPAPWLKKMKRAGYTIVALEQGRTAKNIFSWRPKWPFILIVGNELRGVHQTIQKNADVTLEIPMHGQKESLNVASAMAIAVYALKFAK